MLREVVRPFPNVEVDSFHGLLVDYAARRQAGVILAASAPFPITNTSSRWR